MFAVTITELTPTERYPQGEVVSHTINVDSVFKALKIVEEAELNWSVFLNVSITQHQLMQVQ